MVTIFGLWKGNTVNICVHTVFGFCWVIPWVSFPRREIAGVEGWKHLDDSSEVGHVGIF